MYGANASGNACGRRHASMREVVIHDASRGVEIDDVHRVNRAMMHDCLAELGDATGPTQQPNPPVDPQTVANYHWLCS